MENQKKMFRIRGVLTTYLGLLGITPCISLLSTD